MKKTELQELVQECIAEVLAERSTNEGYDEFQRADKGSKGVAAKDKSAEDEYGAGYVAGEKAAKAKYKKLAEAYKQLKEDGFGLNKDPYEESKEIKEIEKTAAPMSTDAKAVISIIEKIPMLLQKLSLLNSRNELEDVFNYLFVKINPQLSKNTTGIRTAATNAAQNLSQEPKEIEEARFEKGEDIGKPGKGFLKITKAAGKKYGSEEAGKKVAGAMLKKVLAKKK
jgi:hypothetical protein